jgi:transposase, IS5 family
VERVGDSLVLRWFCRVYFQSVPDATTVLRWLHTLRPETLHARNLRVVELAVQAKATKGRKLRLDATCVQTEIHHPTDSGLLVDSVRVLSRGLATSQSIGQRPAQQRAAELSFAAAHSAARGANAASTAQAQRRRQRG